MVRPDVAAPPLDPSVFLFQGAIGAHIGEVLHKVYVGFAYQFAAHNLIAFRPTDEESFDLIAVTHDEGVETLVVSLVCCYVLIVQSLSGALRQII